MLLSTVSNKHGSRESISMEALSKTWEADLGNVGFQKLWISLTQDILCHTMPFHALASKHYSSSPEGGWGSHRNVCLLFLRPSKIVFFFNIVFSTLPNQSLYFFVLDVPKMFEKSKENTCLE